MRKLALIPLFFVFSAFAAESNVSETTAKQSSLTGVSINPVVGMSIFSITGSGTEGASNTNGFVGGALVDIDLPVSQLQFETGALFTQEGASGLGGTLTNNYLLIPALAKFTPIESNGSSFHLKGGLAPAILMTSKGEAQGHSADMKSYFNTFDMQMMLGLGGVFATSGKVAITADLTFIRGLLVSNNSKIDGSIYNQGFMLSGGILF